MVFLVKMLSIILVVYGCLLVLRPSILSKLVDYVTEGKRIYISTGIKTAVGVILIFAAPSCSIPWIVYLFGGLTVLGCVTMFIVKKDVVDQLVKWLKDKAGKFAFVAGVASLAVGILLSLAA